MLSVLVVSPNPTVPGGVSVFIECMKRHIEGSKIASFYVGSSGKPGEKRLSTLKRLLSVPLEVARLVRREKFDLVHINPSFDAKSLVRDGLLLFILRLTGFKKTFLYFHGWDFNLQRHILNHKFLQTFAAFVLNRAGLISVLGNDFRDGLVAMGVDPARIVVTQTMFDGAKLDAVRENQPMFRRRFILFMSRFDREKGGRELLDAFSTLAKEYPDVDLVMAGDGADADYLRAQANLLDVGPRIKFVGYVGGADKWTLLRDCTVFALPTYYRSEGMPVAVLEAMGAGKALLVGSAGALRTIVSDPSNGVVLEKVSVESVEVGLRRLLSNLSFMADAGKTNRTLAWEKFEARPVTAEIETYYQKVAQC